MQSGIQISQSVAYQQALDYFEQKKYLESQAWFLQAVILGHNKADFYFCINGLVKPYNEEIASYFCKFADPNTKEKLIIRNEGCDAYTYSVYLEMLLVLILSGKSSKYLKLTRLEKYGVYIDVPIQNKILSFLLDKMPYLSRIIIDQEEAKLFKKINQNNLINPALALLTIDSNLNEIAVRALTTSPRLFMNFMNYCVQNEILSINNYEIILTFVQQFNKNSNLLVAEGYKLLTKLKSKQLYNINPALSGNQSTANVFQVLEVPMSLLTISQQPPSLPPPYPIQRNHHHRIATSDNSTPEFANQFPKVPTDSFDAQFPRVPTHVPAKELANNKLSGEKTNLAQCLEPIYVPLPRNYRVD